MQPMKFNENRPIDTIYLDNGKYMVKFQDGIYDVYRYGELWISGVTGKYVGDMFVLSLIQRVIADAWERKSSSYDVSSPYPYAMQAMQAMQVMQAEEEMLKDIATSNSDIVNRLIFEEGIVFGKTIAEMEPSLGSLALTLNGVGYLIDYAYWLGWVSYLLDHWKDGQWIIFGD